MSQRYRFQNPASEREYEKLYEVMDSAFIGEDVRSIVKRLVEHHPEMTDDNYFMVMDGDEAVAWLLLIPEKTTMDTQQKVRRIR